MHADRTVFGSVRDVSGEAFLDEVDKAPKQTHVIVHVYRHRVEACTRLALQLRKIAAAHTSTKFIAMDADEYKKVCSLAYTGI
jgi:thioredoxin-like negative regulator of GroEL